jgi:hypothetical protein
VGRDKFKAGVGRVDYRSSPIFELGSFIPGQPNDEIHIINNKNQILNKKSPDQQHPGSGLETVDF